MAFFCIHCRSEIDSAFKACPYCGEAITEFLRRYSDTPIDGKYRLLARLGVGGMGEVYKVLHIHLNAIRVVKLMRAAVESDPGAHDRFLREARLATRIQHPNVATLFDFSTLDDGSRYMVWEYIEGTNLHEFLQDRGPLAPRYAARLAIQALRGLDAIHRAGIIHRDISPENLMLTHDDEGNERVKIIDLGIAKQWGDEGDKTKTGMFVGKWKYCSPEHLGILPAGERIDGRADLYSFGIVLYETLTGIPPFESDTPHGYVMLHVAEKPKALLDVNPTVPESPALEALIFRALEKDRTKRFATAREFADALEKILPDLTDSPGALQRQRVAEETEEPTRISAKAMIDEPTLVVPPVAETVRQQAPATTVHSEPEPPDTLLATLPADPRATQALARPARRRGGLIAAIAVVALTVAGGGAFFFVKRHAPAPQPASTGAITQGTAAVPRSHSEASVVAGAKARLALNAFPWANVTSIQNVETRDTVSLTAPIVTPAQIDLAPGRYEITFANPEFPAPVRKIADVRAGDDRVLTVSFADPATVAVPDFGGAR